MTIQIDMFEVGLSSAMLLQFSQVDQVVRVLADGGVGHRRHQDHVLKKLPNCFQVFGESRRIDLIIGTHYDKDHLHGLVPIVEDESIEIGEVWLPPVANDTQITEAAENIMDEDFLALQFARDDGDDLFRQYIKEKRLICFKIFQQIKLKMASHNYERSSEIYHDFEAEENLFNHEDKIHTEKFLGFLKESEIILGAETGNHDSDLIDEDIESLEEMPEMVRNHFNRSFARRAYFSVSVNRDEIKPLALILRSAARDAINATYLNKLVRALKARNIPMRCATIPDGHPRNFVWSRRERCFRPGHGKPEEDIVLKLLGPSDGLVAKHRHRLPIGAYIAFLNTKWIRPKKITPSNQLSYVVKFAFERQNILVSGDAGFVDFKIPRKRQFHKKIIVELSDLQVIQIAHHGGSNGHFYNGLLRSDLTKRAGDIFLLLSHEVNDSHRPSIEFSRFVEEILQSKRVLSILFSCKPKESKIRDFKSHIHKVVGQSSSNCGDVRLCFDGANWKVLKNSVEF